MAVRFSGHRRSSLTAAVRKGSSPSSSSIFGELCSRSLRCIQRANEFLYKVNSPASSCPAASDGLLVPILYSNPFL